MAGKQITLDLKHVEVRKSRYSGICIEISMWISEKVYTVGNKITINFRGQPYKNAILKTCVSTRSSSTFPLKSNIAE
jgi:hypothetical protein